MAPMEPSIVDQRAGDEASTLALWQHYIAERDQLFTRSRTISVSEMATTLAHELNQPLGAINNILNGLKARASNSELDSQQIVGALNLAIQQTQFASRVIARIRDYTETREPAIVDIDVHNLLQHSVELLDWVFSAEAVKVNVLERCPNTPTLLVQADYTMMQQVITNLLRNAVEAMRETPQESRIISTNIASTIDGIKIEITDAGHGLASNESDSLFTPFQSTKKDGMGVGLNICRSFVELHQGKLWITPNEQNGCTAHILMPQTDEKLFVETTSDE